MKDKLNLIDDINFENVDLKRYQYYLDKLPNRKDDYVKFHNETYDSKFAEEYKKIEDKYRPIIEKEIEEIFNNLIKEKEDKINKLLTKLMKGENND